MIKQFGFILIIGLFLIGCTASNGEEPVILDAVTNEQSNTLTAVKPPPTAVSEAEETEMPAENETQPEPTEDSLHSPDTNGEDTSEVAPVESNLAEVPSDSPHNDDPAVKPTPGVPESVTNFIQEIVADLSQRLGIESSEITVVQVDEVTWRDGSIGCPQPGMMYTMALVSGYRIILEVQGTKYYYHSGGTNSFILCEDDVRQEPLPDNMDQDN